MSFLKSDISFSSLNTRGLKDKVKRKAILKTQCIFLQETHSCEDDTLFWKNQWGDNILFSHGSNRSGGVAICFHNFPGEIVTSKTDKDGHWIAVVVNLEGSFAILINFYGYNNAGQNKLLLDSITAQIAEYKKLYGIDLTLLGEILILLRMIGWTEVHPGTVIITIMLY